VLRASSFYEKKKDGRLGGGFFIRQKNIQPSRKETRERKMHILGVGTRERIGNKDQRYNLLEEGLFSGGEGRWIEGGD